jgi:ankyrin repeat protein
VPKQFVYESLSDYLKPKSEEEIRKSLGNLTRVEKLFKGAKHGILWLIQEALDEGADPSMGKNYAIRLAAQYGHLEIVKLLLKDKRVNPAAEYNFAIRWASKHNHIEIVKLLLKDKRVNPAAENNRALFWAAENQNKDMVKLLLQDKRVLSEDLPSNLKYNKELAYLLEGFSDYLKPKSEEEIKNIIMGMTPNQKLIHACDEGLLWLAKEALDEGADPATNNNSPINWASRYGYIDIIKLLLQDERTDPTANDNRAIRRAWNYDQYDVIKLLMTDKRVYDSISKDGRFNFIFQTYLKNL